MEEGELVASTHHHRDDALSKDAGGKVLSARLVAIHELVFVSDEHVVVRVDHPSWKDLLGVKETASKQNMDMFIAGEMSACTLVGRLIREKGISTR